MIVQVDYSNDLFDDVVITITVISLISLEYQKLQNTWLSFLLFTEVQLCNN